MIRRFPSQDKLRGFTTVLGGTPPNREQVKKEYILEHTKGLEVKWYD